MQKKHFSRDRKAGQAFIEFTVCIVAMLTVLGTLIQIGLLGQKRTETYMNATAEATEGSASSSYSIALLGGPSYIQEMEVGPDGVKYSADDEENGGNSGVIMDSIVVHSTPGRLQNFAGGNRISNLATGNASMIAQFELVRGRDTEQVELIPVVRNMMYQGSSIDMEQEVYMTWLKGLY